jgi:hypothetical protein
MPRYWYIIAIVLGVPCTLLMAARHELGWTIVGALSVWCNIYNLTNIENKEGE